MPNVPLACLVAYLGVVHYGQIPIGQEVLALGLVAVVLSGQRIRLPEPLLWFAALVGWAFLSAIASDWAVESLQHTFDLLKIWLIAFLTINAIRSLFELRMLILVWVSLFALFPLRGTYFNYLAGIGEMGRFHWNFIFGNPNDLGAFALFPLAFCAGLLNVERNKFIRFCALLGIPALLFLIVITQSRGVLLALATFAIIVFIRQRNRVKLGLFGLVCGLMVLIAAPEKVWSRVSGLAALAGGVERVTEIDPEQSATGRYNIWRVAAHIIERNPIAGIGWGAYQSAHNQYYTDVSDLSIHAMGRRDTHSTYLRVAAESGIPSLLIFLGFVWSTRRYVNRCASRLSRTQPRERIFLLVLAAGQLAYLQAGLFGSFAHLPFLYIYSMVLIAAAELLTTAASAAGSASMGRIRYLGGRRLSGPAAPTAHRPG
jgi:O-antigen ligase